VSHTIELSDEQYAVVKRNAEREGVNPQAFLAEIINRLPSGVMHDDADDFSRALGDTDEEITEAKRQASMAFPPDVADAIE